MNFETGAIGNDCSRLGVRVLDASSPPGDSNQGLADSWSNLTKVDVKSKL